ncbi:polymorphic toxin type 50 domain-containing protein [Helcococcus bovis]|uniref:polymorphic toxin type 50 domain-containing protein n=1 Tax=Helcococcus bovis TaxID=3153252 RepID=UPI0038B9FC32
MILKKDDKIEIRKRHNIQIKDINRKDDREQYKKYMDILGEDRMPKSLSAFQNLKYDNPVEYEKLKDHVFIQNNFNKGIWKDEINIDKQKRHIQSTAGEYKSYFYDDVDVEKLYNEYKMTGRFRQIKGDIKNHEIVDFKETINLGIDIYSGNIANGMTIHYSKTGSHLIPTYHREE